MPRIRTVKPQFWEDEKIACLSREARLLYIGTFNLADDEGLLRWTAPYLKSNLFMYDDDLTVSDVQALMDEVIRQSFVLVYTPAAARGSAKQHLAWIVKFRLHQKINRPQPSKLPPPSLQNVAVQHAYAVRDDFMCQLCLGPVNETPVAEPDYHRGGNVGWPCLNPSLDHINPRVKGGKDHPTNVRLAHIGCNKSRGSLPTSEFKVPMSVQHALTATGWLIEADVNDSRPDSWSSSLPEKEEEMEMEEEVVSPVGTKRPLANAQASDAERPRDHGGRPQMNLTVLTGGVEPGAPEPPPPDRHVPAEALEIVKAIVPREILSSTKIGWKLKVEVGTLLNNGATRESVEATLREWLTRDGAFPGDLQQIHIDLVRRGLGPLQPRNGTSAAMSKKDQRIMRNLSKKTNGSVNPLLMDLQPVKELTGGSE